MKLTQFGLIFFASLILSITQAQFMCSDQFGSGITNSPVPIPFYYDVPTNGASTTIFKDYFNLTCKAACSDLDHITQTVDWELHELNIDGSTPTSTLDRLRLTLIQTTLGSPTTKVQGIPNESLSPYRFEIKMTIGTATPVLQQFIVYVTRPMNVSLVLDMSGSMGAQADPSVAGVTRLDVLKAAAGKFLNYFKIFLN